MLSSLIQRPSNLLITYKQLQIKRHLSRLIYVLELLQRHKESIQQIRDASGPNWELYRPNSSRFYLPGAVSLAKYVSGEETIDERPLQQLVDFHRMRSNLVQIDVMKCPTLLQEQILQIYRNNVILGDISVITLSYAFYDDLSIGKVECEEVAKTMVERLKLAGYWTTCSNTFHGNETEIAKAIAKLRVRVENFKGCVRVDEKFENSEVIYTTAPKNIDDLKKIIFRPKMSII